MGKREIRTGILLGLGCLLAGVGPLVASGPALQRLAAAAAFAVPAVAPFFFRVRETGVAAAVVAAALVAAASLAGMAVVANGDRTLAARNLQMASAGALSGAVACGIAWARETARRDA